ncbi:MAG: phosphoribosylanthranilate isomerase [Anaerolineales bacterium]|nr:phosphoribosylanthranilate isomerase [Anaerolineales bacterium]MCB8953482.1 phosphoribosylanthranilate isomerase [Ardenticatenales bacterium]
MTRVKICGITNLEDAQVAAAAGADYLGFILWPGSKRAITPAAAAIICDTLCRQQPRPLLVGVFVNVSGAEMAAHMDACGFDLAQLHGEEVPALIGDPASPLYGRAYKGLRPTSLAEAEAEAEWYQPPQRHPDHPALLIDTFHPNLRGGTGQTTDWQMAAHLAAQIPGLMLAGGLTPDNVAQAVRQVRPFAVDVASGVESAPGRKDHKAIHRFVTAVRSISFP